MTWKRVATAAVLIPFAVGIVLWGSTAVVALALALVTLLALFEYFALGEAIGHRAYRFWTATCALGLVYVQWWTASLGMFGYVGIARKNSPTIQSLDYVPGHLLRSPPTVADVLFIFLLGVAVLTLWTKRPIVEALPAAGISSSARPIFSYFKCMKYETMSADFTRDNTTRSVSIKLGRNRS